MLYDSRKSGVSRIEKQAGIKFEHVSAPQPNDIAKAIGMEAAEKITQVCDTVVPAFLAAAKELLESSGVSAEVLLAKALAKTAVSFLLNHFCCLKGESVLKSYLFCRALLRLRKGLF